MENNRDCDAKLHELLTGAKPWTFTDDLGTRLVAWTGMSTFESLPHYTTNANDIARAEQALPANLRNDYAYEVGRALGLDIYAYFEDWFVLITATAAQRAQALVAVLERVRGEVGN